MTGYHSRIHSEFERELWETACWYEDQASGLGLRWIEQVELAVDMVMRMPESHARLNDRYRYRMVGGYPYIVVFEVRSTSVDFLAVQHTSRDLLDSMKNNPRTIE